MGLLQVATVIQGDGKWTSGYEIESWGCGIGEYLTDICTPTPVHVAGSKYMAEDTNTKKVTTPVSLSASPGKAGSVKIEPFGYTAGLVRNTQCTGELETPKVTEFIAASEAPLASVFGGDDTKYTALQASVETLFTAANTAKPSVNAVTKGSNEKDSVKALIKAWAAKSVLPLDGTIIHLGVDSAFDMSSDVFKILDRMGIKTAISPWYKSDLVALTGPIAIRLSSIQTLKTYNQSKNEVYFEATRIAAIEFDPCLAFRAA